MEYVKTETGQAAFRQRSSLISARQRAAFILFDGVKSLEQVLVATAGLGVTRLEIEQLVTQGFLKSKSTSTSGTAESIAAPSIQHLPAAVFGAKAGGAVTNASESSGGVELGSVRTPQQRYSEAKPLATQLTASLGLRGFLLNLGVESADGYDELLALFPKIQAAVGAKKCGALGRALKG